MTVIRILAEIKIPLEYKNGICKNTYCYFFFRFFYLQYFTKLLSSIKSIDLLTLLCVSFESSIRTFCKNHLFASRGTPFLRYIHRNKSLDTSRVCARGLLSRVFGSDFREVSGADFEKATTQSPQYPRRRTFRPEPCTPLR